MTRPRSNPYVWVTWLPQLIKGSRTCIWAAWFMAHFTDFKRADRGPFMRSIEHTTLLNRTREQFEEQGYAVFSEDTNKFKVTSKSGRVTIGGTPDLIAIGDRPLIVEVKSGKEQDYHKAQLLMYMHYVPLASNLPYRDLTFDGVLVYNNKIEHVPATDLNDFRPHLKELLGYVVREKPATKIPSWKNCRFCKLTSEDCPEKIEEEPLD